MKTIIFDFDGTIGDSRSLIVKTMQQTIQQLGLPTRTDDQCAAMIGLPLRQTFTDLIDMDDKTADKCFDTYNELFNKNNKPGAVRVYPGVKETMEELYLMGLSIAIASSRGRESLEKYLKEMDIEQYVSYIVSANDVANAKPAPDMVYKICSHTQGHPDEVLVIGDTHYDIEMGRNAGVKTCGVTYGIGKEEELKNADYVIDNISQVLEIV